MTDLFPDAPAQAAPVADRRACKSCKGSGKAYQWEYEKARGEAPKPCYSCQGRGWFGPPDAAAIIAAIKGRKGLRSSRPKDDSRAYFCWRLARFHGGADVTMPMGAEMEVRGDPYVKELDAIADAVAQRVYGTNLAAAHRWGRLLGYLPSDKEMPGLPATAYESGPVLGFGATKPEEERNELDPTEDEVEEEAEDIQEARVRDILTGQI
jgi:hypothetical protein